MTFAEVSVKNPPKDQMINIICILFSDLDGDHSLDDDEEKQRLISQVLELQNTLDGKIIIYFIFSEINTCKIFN